MLARRRAKPGVTSLARLRIGRWRNGREALALLRRQRCLVLRPLLAQLAALLGGRFRHALEVLAGLRALLRAQVRPALHAVLHALLLERLHRGIALGDADPLAASIRREVCPVALQRCEDALLLGGELGPLGPRLGGFLRRLRNGRLLRRRLVRAHFGGLRCDPAREARGEEGKEEAAHHSSAPRLFSQFWKPR